MRTKLDFTKLYRELKTVNISGVDLKYYVPSFTQKGLIIDYVNSLYPLCIEDTREKAFFTNITKIYDIFTSGDTKEQGDLVIRLFTNNSTNLILYKVVSECFPEIENPALLNTDSLVIIINTLLMEFQPS